MTPEKTLIRNDTLAELREELKKLQAENKKLRECVGFFALLDHCGEYGFERATECLRELEGDE